MCSANSLTVRAASPLAAALLILALGLLAGCIADTAEDSDLPWSSNKNWEGMGPVPASFLDHYD